MLYPLSLQRSRVAEHVCTDGVLTLVHGCVRDRSLFRTLVFRLVLGSTADPAHDLNLFLECPTDVFRLVCDCRLSYKLKPWSAHLLY